MPTRWKRSAIKSPGDSNETVPLVDSSYPQADRAAPPGFEPLSSSCEFVTRAGTFFICSDGESARLGAWVGTDQADAAGNADRGFLLTFGDFALTEVTQGITLRLSVDCLGAARLGDWIEARVIKCGTDSSTLIFAEAVIESGGKQVMRLHGAFLPFVKPSYAG
jgi:hypothetical protein